MPRPDSVKYFPFAPGIPWKIKGGRYVVPQIDQQVWNSVLANKDLVVMAYGGLLESFCSLAIVEALTQIEPSKPLFWTGNEPFRSLVQSQGLARNRNIEDLSENYPVPLFLDRENLAYFNALNNYPVTRSYSGVYEKKNWKIVFSQIFINSLVQWNKQYLPKIRNFDPSSKYTEWAKINKFHDNQRYIFILPEKTEYSRQTNSCLNWNINNVREFAALVRRFGLNVVVCAESDSQYYNSSVIRAPIDIDIIIPLISKSWMVLAEQIDFLIIALALSKAHIISLPHDKKFDLYKHADLFEVENVIFTSTDVSPPEIYSICEGMR